MPEDAARPPGEPAAQEPGDLLDVVQAAVDSLAGHPDASVREASRRLLEGIDAIHRTALRRLVGTLEAMGGDALMTRLVADPAIRLLLMSYDLVAVDRRLMAEEALDAVRGHLHAHGVDVELIDVLGGVVSVQVHGLHDRGVDEGLVRHDIERALREGLRGFQQLEIGRRQPTTSGGTVFVPLSTLRRLRAPVRHTVARLADLPADGLLAVEVEGYPILLARVDDEVVAVRNRCGDSPLPLQYGTLHEGILRCSWHGCQYEMRTGRRVDGPGPALPVVPVTVEDDDVRVTVATTADGAQP